MHVPDDNVVLLQNTTQLHVEPRIQIYWTTCYLQQWTATRLRQSRSPISSSPQRRKQSAKLARCSQLKAPRHLPECKTQPRESCTVCLLEILKKPWIDCSDSDLSLSIFISKFSNFCFHILTHLFPRFAHFTPKAWTKHSDFTKGTRIHTECGGPVGKQPADSHKKPQLRTNCNLWQICLKNLSFFFESLSQKGQEIAQTIPTSHSQMKSKLCKNIFQWPTHLSQYHALQTKLTPKSFFSAQIKILKKTLQGSSTLVQWLGCPDTENCWCDNVVSTTERQLKNCILKLHHDQHPWRTVNELAFIGNFFFVEVLTLIWQHKMCLWAPERAIRLRRAKSFWSEGRFWQNIHQIQEVWSLVLRIFGGYRDTNAGTVVLTALRTVIRWPAVYCTGFWRA